MNQPASPQIPALQRRDGYLGCVDAELHVNGRAFPIALDIFGHVTPASVGSSSEPAEPRRVIIARAMLESHDLSVVMPSGALDAISDVILKEIPQ